MYREDMHHYQERAVKFIHDTKRCMLALDMGLGKSISTLTAVSELSDSFKVNKILVIAPLRVANSVWKQEAALWDHTKHTKVVVCTGDARERMAALMNTADVYVINRENIAWLVEHHGAKWSFDCIVVDESCSFKNSGSKRFRALKKILPKTSHVVLLTGTPAPNGLIDLWSQMYLIDFGERLGRTKDEYEKNYFEKDYTGHKLILKSGAAAAIHARIADVVLSMSAKDYLEVPEKINLFERVTLPTSVMDDYVAFEERLFLDLPDGEEVEAATAAVLVGKLQQFSNGAIYTDEQKNWSHIHDEKLDALEEIVEINEGENILVAYSYKHDLERLKVRFPTARVLDNKQSTLDDWCAGKIKMLLCHPASAGHGLNLQDGGCIAVWFGVTWSLGLYQQFNARLHRQGQQRPVRIIHIVSEGCIDDRIVDVLKGKDIVQRDLLKALRRKQNENKMDCSNS